MPSTPSPRYVCPRCRASYEAQTHYCGRCGADMQRASALEMAAIRESGVDPARSDDSAVVRPDRRLSASNETWLGRIVDGRYRVIEVVGRGGMGVVYKVEHTRMGKIAAMKVLHRDLADDPEVIQRFEREATAVSRLQHPNTVQVFDFGASQGALYLIMEYVRGQDLAHIVDRDGPLPLARAAPLLVQICGALSEAHELGIVHRDLKPENVLVTRTHGGRDFAKVLDFGLAKLGAREQAPEVTDRTEIVGTPYYMSPEQIRGDEVDQRSDVYSLGALMYRVLTGQYAYDARTAVGVLTKHLTATLEVPSLRAPELSLDPELDAIVMKAMAKQAGDRFPTAAAMAAAIEQLYLDQVGDASPLRLPAASKSLASPRRPTTNDDAVSDVHLRRSDLDAYERSLQRRKLGLGVGVSAVVLAGLAVGAWYLLRAPRPSSHEREPNNSFEEPTLIAASSAVTGYLGRRVSKTEADRDFYVVAHSGRWLASVTATELPNIDVVVVLRDRGGGVITQVDEGGVGDVEQTHRRWVEGPLIVEVTEAMRIDQRLPTENVSDPYTLTVSAAADDAAIEAEPNSSAADAVPLELGTAVTGWLDTRDDIDLLRWNGGDGTYSVTVAAPPELPLLWRHAAAPARAQGPATVEMTLRHGDLLRLERADRDRPRGQRLPGVDAAWTVTVKAR